MELEEIQSKVLKEISIKENVDGGVNINLIINRFKKESSELKNLDNQQIYQALWLLINHGLIYLDFKADAQQWRFWLTDRGKEAVKEGILNPDNKCEYMKRIKEMVPDINDTVKLYLNESLNSYNCGNFLSSVMMLGVSSEAAFLEMAKSYGNWLLRENEKKQFLETMEGKKNNFINKFFKFKKSTVSHIAELPSEFKDDMPIMLDSVLNFLRINRNEAGHPTGKNVSRYKAFTCLQMFANYLERLYELKIFFEDNNNNDTQTEHPLHNILLG